MKRPAFSVPEMLAVIAIVVIILSILLPVYNRSRTPAHQMACANNIRNLVRGSISYTIDNNQWLPFTNWLSQEDGGAGDWTSAGWLYKYPNRTVFGDHRKGQLWKYMNEDKMYRCPIDAPPYIPNCTHQITSYLMNGAYTAFGGNYPSIVYKSFRVRPDGVMFWEVDEKAAAGSYNDASSSPNEPVTKRHQIGLTVGMRDGHTEWWTYDDYNIELAKNPGRLYCTPQ